MKTLSAGIFLAFSLLCISPSSASTCEKAANFSLRDQSGEMRSLDRIISADPGKTIFISFFQTTCAPCIEEIRDLMTFRSSHESIRLVLVDSKESRDETYKFLKKYNFSADYILNDPNGKLDSLYNISSIPRLVVINKTGELTWDFSGTELFNLRSSGIFLKKLDEIIGTKKCR